MKTVPIPPMRLRQWLLAFVCASAAVALNGQPLIIDVVETGGDNEATDTIVAKWTGITWNTTVANEPLLNTAAGTPYTVPIFGEDVPCYVDRNHSWNGATVDVPLPDYLVGGDYIMSGNDNRDNADYKLVVTLSDAAIVYLLIDNRYPDGDNTTPPNYAEGLDPTGWTTGLAWMGTEGFQPVFTGANRNLDPSMPDEVGVDEGGNGTGPGGDIQQWSTVYSKTLSGPGTFTVYQPDNASRNMYGVVVKRLPNSVNNPPEVSGLTPANNTLFHPAANGLSFTATTVSPNTIATGNIKLYLNDTDVSGNLTIGGTGTRRTASYSTLQADTLYAARIVVSDQAGRTMTNAFTFDTFSATTAVAIEAEDYNYEGGKFVAAPTPGGYANLLGTRDIDFHNNNRTTPNTVYRSGDYALMAVTTDVARKAFADAGATDHQLTTLLAGDWWNYTRSLADNTYRVYLRGSSALSQRVRLDRVGGNPASANQSVAALGTFVVGPGTASFTYAPLADASGNPVVVRLSGNTTLRLTALAASVNLQLNYLLLVPTTTPASGPYLASATPAPGADNVAPDANLILELSNGSATVNESSVVLSLNGKDVTSSAVKTPSSDGLIVTYDPPGLLDLASTQTVRLMFGDTGGASAAYEWSFTTVSSLVTIPANFGTPVGSGQGSGFNFKIRKAPNTDSVGTAFTLANTAARANQQLADLIIDSETGMPYVNEAAGPNNNGVGTTTLVNYNQDATVASGFFPADAAFPYVDTNYTPDPNNIAMEFTTYVALSSGIHRFGVRSDDGFQLACGPTVAQVDATMVLGQYEGGRGDGLPGGATEFEFLVEADGVYPLRMIYYEGNGDARVELYSMDRETSTRTLLNDSSAGAVKAFTSRSTQVYVPTVSITSPAKNAAFSTAPTNVVISASASVTGGQVAKVEFFDGYTNKIGESAGAPYTMTWNNLSGGRYTVWARATDNRGITKDSEKVTFSVALVVQVNFQDATSEGVEGYLADTGEVFDDRGNGYSYGWDADNMAYARNRNNALSPDERYDTFNHLQKDLPAGRLWEIEIPNGRYNVFVVVGESDNTDSIYDLTAEGATIVKGTPTASTLWFETLSAVTVSDGRLSLGNGPTASNNKLAFVEIYRLPAEVPKPVLNPPTLSNGAFTVTWSGGRLQESGDMGGQWSDVPGSPQGSYTTPVTSAARKFYRVVAP
ncbi:MAG TPA: Ig-like domain-containing protein [Verrucomicrobiota bacterium]|nr:Ig-like domain-containing protein [Verrucomicrobiota bacterium]